MEQEEVVRDLKGVNINIGSLSDLVNRNWDYAPAIPVLVEHLGRPHHHLILDMLARALIIPQCRSSETVLAALVRALRSVPIDTEQQKSARWGIAYAISQLAGPEFEEALIGLIRDKSLGRARSAFLLARVIVKSNRPGICELLVDLLSDSETDVIVFSIDALAKRRCSNARGELHRLTTHHHKEVARRARKGLKKLPDLR